LGAFQQAVMTLDASWIRSSPQLAGTKVNPRGAGSEPTRRVMSNATNASGLSAGLYASIDREW
jgi:hypothetical protein